MRDKLRSYLTDYLTDGNAIGVLDQTGFLKKGSHSAAVARQYSGTAGKSENCQIGVFLSYASAHGHTLLDRELYLPQEWIDDRERCRRAGIPDQRAFATKPALALQMLQRTFEAGVVLAWVTGDSIYGDDRALRQWLESRPQPYVLAVSGKEAVWIDSHQRQVKTILAELPADGWETLSAGAGSKGPRWYDWRRLELSESPERGWKRFLLVRRSISDPSDPTGYIAFARSGTSLAELVRVAGMRSPVEESIECAKGEVGLDHYEVRSFSGWYRHMTLAMWASAFLSVIREEMGAEVVPKKGRPNQRTRSSLAAFKASRNLVSG